MPYNRYEPYNDLPPLPPKGVELETKAVLRQAIAANRELARLNAAANLLPDQSVLIRLIGLREAQFSSEIENIVTTNDELYRAFAGETNDDNPAAKEVLRYNDALWYGFRALREEKRPLDTPLFAEIAGILLQGKTEIRRKRVSVSGSKGVVYTPPLGEAILREKLDGLAAFLAAPNELDPLIKMAAAHYQFEAIHPFLDGNGRTGRIVNILYLTQSGLLDLPILYLSRYILSRRAEYYVGLQGVTDYRAWEAWILFLLRGVEESSRETFRLIHSLRALRDETATAIQRDLPKIYSRDLIEVLFAQPYCRVRFLEEKLNVNRQTAAKYLQALTAAGFLVREERGRDVYYLNHAFLDALQNAAAQEPAPPPAK